MNNMNYNSECPFCINGYKLYKSIHAVEEAPVKEHKKRSWMSGRCYHERIQKKWVKKFGYEYKPCILSVPADSALFVHPSLWSKIEEEIEKNNGIGF